MTVRAVGPNGDLSARQVAAPIASRLARLEAPVTPTPEQSRIHREDLLTWIGLQVSVF